LRFANASILPWKHQGIRLSSLEVRGIVVAMIIVFGLLWTFHARNWAYPIAFYAVLLVGYLVRILRLVSRR
jgi:hypothetical protein